MSGRSDNDPSGRPCKRRTVHEHVMSVASCSCLDPCQPSDSDDDIPGVHSAREDPSRFINDAWQGHEATQNEVVVSSKRARTASTPYGTLKRAPPPYATPSGVTPISSVMLTQDSEAEMTSERINLNVDTVGQPLSSAQYPNIERFAFTPVPIGAPGNSQGAGYGFAANRS